MVPRDAPEVIKWSPGLPKWRHQAPQMETPRSQKGPAPKGVALEICFEIFLDLLKDFSGSLKK